MAWGGPEEQQHERASGNPNAKDWHDKAHQMLERVSQEYWDAGTVVPSGTVTAGDAATDMSENENTLQSDYDHFRRDLVQQQNMNDGGGGWKAELHRYLGDRPCDVMRDTDIVEWWAVSVTASFACCVLIVIVFQNHTREYPTLTHITQDICAIPAMSVPCEHLFSAGAKIATDCHNHLGSDKFEQLQILKHMWRPNICDLATINSGEIKEVHIQEFKELLCWDVDTEAQG